MDTSSASLEISSRHGQIDIEPVPDVRLYVSARFSVMPMAHCDIICSLGLFLSEYWINVVQLQRVMTKSTGCSSVATRCEEVDSTEFHVFSWVKTTDLYFYR